MYGEVEDLLVDEKIILKRIFNKLDEDVGTHWSASSCGQVTGSCKHAGLVLRFRNKWNCTSTPPYAYMAWIEICHFCMCVYVSFKTSFYAVWHLDSTASYLPTGLHLGFFRSWSSLYLPSSFSSVFLVLSFVSASTSMLFWVIFLLPFFGPPQNSESPL